ncbi:MAG: Kdo hydroxylase family protein [Acidobacteria bacterium]|nr:Kdo hydroxylase family protein [Acidobacteriota bacterium]
MLLFPELPFPIEETESRFLSPRYADPATKNISFDIRNGNCVGHSRIRQRSPEPSGPRDGRADPSRSLP